MIEQPLAAGAIDEAGELQSMLEDAIVRGRIGRLNPHQLNATDRKGRSAGHQYQKCKESAV